MVGDILTPMAGLVSLISISQTNGPVLPATTAFAAIAVDSVHLGRLDEHANDPTAEHNETHHPNAERHETVKQGGHKDELEVGDYVIAGAFKVEANAKKYSEGLRFPSPMEIKCRGKEV